VPVHQKKCSDSACLRVPACLESDTNSSVVDVTEDAFNRGRVNFGELPFQTLRPDRNVSWNLWWLHDPFFEIVAALPPCEPKCRLHAIR